MTFFFLIYFSFDLKKEVRSKYEGKYQFKACQ